LSHSSILQGIAASKAQRMAFAHNDLDALEQVLAANRPQHGHCLIVVEGIYSMDGDIADLPRLIALKHKYNCWLMVDDAHAIGVLGATGRGTAEHFGVDPREIDLLIGTLSKSLVASGGFIAGDAMVVRLLKYTLPGFAYSVGISPVETAAALAALRILKAEPERVRRVQALSQFFVAEAERRGLNVGYAAGFGIVPIMIAGISEVLAVSEIMRDAGIFAPPILRIGVPKDKPRLRFFISAAHKEEDIVRVLDALANALAAIAQAEPRRASS
jgi:8-amino-7-oxononanoate synthase